MTPPKIRRLPLAGLGLVGAGGALGLALSMPGAAYAAPGRQGTTSAERAEPGEPAPAPADTSTSLLEARLDRAVEHGKLTPEQAASILTAARTGLLNGDLVTGPGRDGGPPLDRQPGR